MSLDVFKTGAYYDPHTELIPGNLLFSRFLTEEQEKMKKTLKDQRRRETG